MGPVFVIERSVAASQGFELAGLVLERNTSQSANWGCPCREWHGDRSFLYLLILVCLCAYMVIIVQECVHVRVWLRRVLWSTLLSPALLCGWQSKRGSACSQHFPVELWGSHGELGLKYSIVGAPASDLRKSFLGSKQAVLTTFFSQTGRTVGFYLYTYTCS